MEKARQDGKPLVYIGFGSITVPDPRSVSEHIVDAVVKSTSSRVWSGLRFSECSFCRRGPRDYLEGMVGTHEHENRQRCRDAGLMLHREHILRPIDSILKFLLQVDKVPHE